RPTSSTSSVANNTRRIEPVLLRCELVPRAARSRKMTSLNKYGKKVHSGILLDLATLTGLAPATGLPFNADNERIVVTPAPALPFDATGTAAAATFSRIITGRTPEK